MKKALSVVLVLCCLIIGYGFYRMNNQDCLTGFFIAFGLTGLVFSILREKKTAGKKS